MDHRYPRTLEFLDILEPLFRSSILHLVLNLEVLEPFSYRFLDFRDIPLVFLK